jgi:hypothetical protein
MVELYCINLSGEKIILRKNSKVVDTLHYIHQLIGNNG